MGQVNHVILLMRAYFLQSRPPGPGTPQQQNRSAHRQAFPAIFFHMYDVLVDYVMSCERQLHDTILCLGLEEVIVGFVVNADFIKSSVRPDDCPRDGLPEFALVGRSNVGKSSLLNSLVRRKRLALTSKKPGKTQCINHFKINDSWYLVDLPGYGYASAPQVARKDWDEFTRNYFLSRDNLVSVFLLIDASIPAKNIDLDYASWLGQNKIC
uniref:GTP-binding protein n=1 Tax=Aegilops tauschii TaxID=37682 RepID=M8AWI4_AEGTA